MELHRYSEFTCINISIKKALGISLSQVDFRFLIPTTPTSHLTPACANAVDSGSSQANVDPPLGPVFIVVQKELAPVEEKEEKIHLLMCY